MKIPDLIPTPTRVVQEGIIVLGGILLAALVLSRFPALRNWVSAQSITIKDPQGKTLF
jgi:hypothetical protein